MPNEKWILKKWKHLPQYNTTGESKGLYCVGCLTSLNYFNDEKGRCPRCVAYKEEAGEEITPN